MSETDVKNMKVADLKRELKLRGLSTAGNKTELSERLQSALLDGELSLEDTAISGEDLLDDEVLTDEEKDILSDEKELLKSPSATDKEKDLLLDSPEKESPPPTESLPPKKIILKRKISITSPTTTSAPAATEKPEASAGATEEKVQKMSERNPITALGSESTEAKATKVTQLTNAERLALRAKKFGIAETTPAPAAPEATETKPTVAAAAGTTEVKDEKQIELLKKRAERFGCVVAPVIADIKEQERLQKRKERFGGAEEASPATASSESSDVYAEKARLRLERFKTTAAQ